MTQTIGAVISYYRTPSKKHFKGFVLDENESYFKVLVSKPDESKNKIHHVPKNIESVKYKIEGKKG